MSSALYQPNTIEGTSESWIRSNQTVIYNPLGQTPVATINRETAYNLPDGSQVTKPLDQVTEFFNTPEQIVNIISPVDGSQIPNPDGTPMQMSMGMIMAIIYSLEIYVFTQHDSAPPSGAQ